MHAVCCAGPWRAGLLHSLAILPCLIHSIVLLPAPFSATHPLSIPIPTPCSFTVQFECYGEMRSEELQPGGSQIPVTGDNRREYVALYCDWVLQRSVEKQFAAFRRGFLRVSGGERGSLLLAAGWIQLWSVWQSSAVPQLWRVPAVCQAIISKPPAPALSTCHALCLPRCRCAAAPRSPCSTPLSLSC